MVVLSPEDGVKDCQRPKANGQSRQPAGPPARLRNTHYVFRIPYSASRFTFRVSRFLAALGLAWLLTGCGVKNQKLVVVYASQDQVYAEPILKEFTLKTGIEARAVYDNEAVKTVGLSNRLLAERARPQCDVFWNNEALRTHQLAAQNLFRETDSWRAMGYRSRRVVINTNQVSPQVAPTNLSQLTNAAWRGRVALAYPLFGTTATHFLALRQLWGDERWLTWCRALQANQPLLVDGNSVVVQLVGRGEAWIGLTDSDDIAAGQREGLPIASLPLSDESLLIPNTVAVTRGAPHPAAAQKLFEYLQQPEVLEKLIAAHALEGSTVASARTPTLQLGWDKLVNDLEAGTKKLKDIFLR